MHSVTVPLTPIKILPTEDDIMKVLLSALLTAVVATSVFAYDQSVDDSIGLLSEANQALANEGKIAFVREVEKTTARREKPSSGIGQVQQALVQESSCSAGIYVDFLNYSTQKYDCEGKPVGRPYLTSANVNVEIGYNTPSYDWTDITVRLYAKDIYYGGKTLLDSVSYTYESDIWGNGANTVVFIVDGSYTLDNGYKIYAEVDLADEYGPVLACEMDTLPTIISE